MKKVMLLAALLAMLVVAAVPAIAQVTQEFEQETDSGDLDQSSAATVEGDNSTQCIGDQLNGNTGNLQSEGGVIQYASSGSPSGAGDTSLTINDDQEFEESFVSCTTETSQAAAAG